MAAQHSDPQQQSAVPDAVIGEASSSPVAQPPSQPPRNLVEDNENILMAAEHSDLPSPTPETTLERFPASDDRLVTQTVPQMSPSVEQDGNAPMVAEHNDILPSAPEETFADQTPDDAVASDVATAPVPQSPLEEQNDDAPMAAETNDNLPLAPPDNPATETPGKTRSGVRPVVQRVLQMRSSLIPKLPSPKRFSFKKKESK
jgi:hypothetical protein